MDGSEGRVLPGPLRSFSNRLPTMLMKEAVSEEESVRSSHLQYDTLSPSWMEETIPGSQPHWLLNSFWFKGCVSFLVALNTIQMGLEADHPDHRDVWMACEHFFTAVFAIEMTIKLCILRCGYFQDKANWLDALVTVAAVVDTWLLALVGEKTVDLQSLSILRLFRLIRLLRVIKLAKQSRKVVLVLQGLFDALQVTFFVSSFLALCIYASAIFCVEMIGNQTMYPGYTEVSSEINEQEVMTEFNPFLSFGSMGKAMLTLFSIAIFAEWVEVVRPVYLKQPGLALFFVLFALVICFGVMNVIIGMIVESVMNYSSRMAQMDFDIRKGLLRDKIVRVSELIEAQNLENFLEVNAAELEACMRDAAMASLLAEIELPRGFSGKQMMWMLDDDGDGSLHNDAFIGNFERLMDSGPFQQSCMFQAGINEVKYLIRQSKAATEKRISETEAKLMEELQKLPQKLASSCLASARSTVADPEEAVIPELKRPHSGGKDGLQLPVLSASTVDDLCASVAEAVQRALKPLVVEAGEGLASNWVNSLASSNSSAAHRPRRRQAAPDMDADCLVEDIAWEETKADSMCERQAAGRGGSERREGSEEGRRARAGGGGSEREGEGRKGTGGGGGGGRGGGGARARVGQEEEAEEGRRSEVTLNGLIAEIDAS